MSRQEKDISQSAKSNFSVWGWFVIGYTFLTLMFAGNLLIDSLNITLQAFNRLHGWDTGVLLSYSTVAGIIAIAGAGLLGRWVDKYGARFVFTTTLTIVAVCAFLWGHINQIWQYVAILIVVNVFGNGFGFIASTNIIANWFPRKKGLAMGWATIGFQASAVVLLPVFTLILNASGLAMAYNMVGICLIILALVSIFALRNNPEERGCTPDNDKSKSVDEYRRLHEEANEYIKNSPFTLKRLLKTKQIWQIGLVMGLMQMSISGLISQFVPKMMEIGLSQNYALTVYSIASVVGGVFSYLWGVLDQKIGTKRTTVLASLSHGIAGFVCAMAGTVVHSLAWLYFAAFMVAINLGVSSNLLGSFGVTVFGRYDFAKAYTPMYMLTCGIRSFSFITVGMLFSLTGTYTASYIATGLVAVLGMIITFFIKDNCIGRIA